MRRAGAGSGVAARANRPLDVARAGDYFFTRAPTRTHPETTSASKGIYAWRFDSKTGALTPIGLVAETVNPAHVWAGPDGRVLYAVNWSTGDPAGDTVSAFAIDQEDGRTEIAEQSELARRVAEPDRARSVGEDRGDGYLQRRHGHGVRHPARRPAHRSYLHRKHAGQPLSAKQPGPRAHGVVFSKDGRWAYVAQLGLDRVYTYRVDPAKQDVCAGGPAVCDDERRRARARAECSSIRTANSSTSTTRPIRR